MSRIEQLYEKIMERAMEKKHVWPEKYMTIINSDEIKEKPLIIRKALAHKEYLEKMPIEILENELIVGMTAQGTIGYGVGFIDYATKEEKNKAAKIGLGIKSIWGHSLPGYNILLNLGIKGIRKKVKNYLDRINENDKEKEEKLNFYEAILLCHKGFENYILRYKELAQNKAERENNEKRKQELLNIAIVCKNISNLPPKNFEEAIQLLWFTHIALQNTMEYVPIGRFDQYLYPFYKRDIENRRISSEKVQELIDCFWLKANDRMQLKTENIENNFDPKFMQLGGNFDIVLENRMLTNSWHQNVVLGGKDRKGKDATNDLTYMCLESTKKFSLTSPVVTVRLSKSSPKKLYKKCAECIQTGGGYPFIFNDDVIVKALKKLDIPQEEAYDYANDGCWETTIPGKTEFRYSNINLLNCLELALNNGKSRINDKMNGIATGNPKEFKKYEDLYNAFEIQLKEKINSFANNIIRYYGKVYTIAPDPFFSSLIEDCLEKGKDITEGGARYVFHSPLACGLADTTDSLAVIKKFVYDEKKISIEELVEILNKDFKEYEDVRQLFINKAPKFGNNNEYVDNIMLDVFNSYISIVNQKSKEFDKIKFTCGVGTFERYILLGKDVGATPNGRKSGDWIATNCSPTVGSDIDGISSLINSFTRMNFIELPTGSPLNLKISPKFAKGVNGISNLISLLKSFIDLGGNMLQPIMQDSKTLRKAQKEPDKYRDLKVTVGGFQVYFTLLDKEHQDYHIERIEQG